MPKKGDLDKPDAQRYDDRPEDWMSGIGATVGDPKSLRFATGRRNVDATKVGEEMLRGRRPRGKSDGV